jgi:hypothetical protein
MSLTSIAKPASNPQAYTSKLELLSTEQLQRLAQTKDMAVVAAVMGELNRRKQVTTAAQGQQPPQPTVRDQMLASMAPPRLPENLGIGQIPAPNMQNMASGGIVAFNGEKDSNVDEDPMYLANLFKSGKIPDATAASLNKYLEKKKKEEVPSALENPTIGGVISRGISGIGSDIGAGVSSAWDATKRGISSLLPSQRQYAPREAAWLAAQQQPSAESLRNYPVPQGGPRGSAGSPMQDVAAEAAKADTAAGTSPGARPSGLGAATSALKLPDFGSTTPQSISDIAKEAEPFLARRRAENAELLKPEQAAVDALHASIAESKKGDVKQQLLGIAAGFLSSKSPYFAASAGDALTNYMGVSKEQKKFNADAVKEATAAQTALARYKVALDKGDEATAAKYKELADSKADRAIGHQLQGIQLGIAAKQADTQAAHYANIGADSRARLKLAQDAGSHDIKVGQEYTKIQKQVDDMLAKDQNYMFASPEEKEVMRNAALQEKAKNHPLLSKLSGNIGFASGPTGNVFDRTGGAGDS